MKRHFVAPHWVLILSVTACGNILGLEKNSQSVDCTNDVDCNNGEECNNYQCETPSSAGGASEHSATGGKATLFTGGTKNHAGATSTTAEYGTGGLSVAPTSLGGTTAHGGSSDTFTTTTQGGTPQQDGTTSRAGGTTSSGGGTTVTTECSARQSECVTYEGGTRTVYWKECSASGNWKQEILCPDYCDSLRGCLSAPSCEGLNRCDGTISCCNSLPLPAGTYNRSISPEVPTDCTVENPCPATVSAFRLDTYEVTVGRFRNFVKNYPHIPAPGDGKNPHNDTDPGWHQEWAELLPQTKADMLASLQSLADCTGYLYTPDGTLHDKMPVNCVDWFTAFAFCIWDGGRLPTEVEWNYAAAGGEQGRYFPWSVPATNETINLTYATYAKAGTTPAPTNVGFATDGKSRWGQYDLSGNLYEWLLDVATDNYPTTNSCNDCAATDWTEVGLRSVRGGSYNSTETALTTSFRSNSGEQERFNILGFRCVRDL